MKLVDTSHSPDILCSHYHPDVSAYPKEWHDGSAKADFSTMEFFIEIKRTENLDPFKSLTDPESDN